MNAILVAPEWEDIRYIVDHMRQKDREEIFATQTSEDSYDFTQRVVHVGNCSWIAKKDGVPVALFGAYPCHPGVWSVFMFATDDFPKVRMLVTRYIKRFMIPAIVKTSGLHLGFCYSLSTHTEAHKWLQYLGAKKEVEMKEWGKNRENFFMFAWRF